MDVCVWRADARQAAWKDTRVASPQTGPKVFRQCDRGAISFAALKQFFADEVPEGGNKRDAMERIEQRLDPTKAPEGEDEMAKIWAARERESPTEEVYEKSLAGQWRKTGCAAEGAPYVLHGLVARLSNPVTSPFRDRSNEAKALSRSFLDDVQCPGARGLSEDDKAKLKEIAAPAAPQAPKP